MVLTYAQKQKIGFSDCDINGKAQIGRILSWFEDCRFEMSSFIGIQNFFPINHRIPSDNEQIPNQTGEEYYMPVLKVLYREKKKLTYGETILVHTHVEIPKSGQITFLHLISDELGQEIFFYAVYTVGIVSTKMGLKYEVPFVFEEQIRLYLDYIEKEKKGFQLEIGEIENEIHH